MPGFKKTPAYARKTTTLPAKLRDELISTGKLDENFGKNKASTRKAKRKEERESKKRGRSGGSGSAHKVDAGKRQLDSQKGGEKKRKHDSDGVDGSMKQIKGGRENAEGTDTDQTDEPARKKVKQTPLEKLLNKTQSSAPRKTVRRNGTVSLPTDPVEQREDAEIAWLEAQLGIKNRSGQTGRDQWRSEFEQDGLGELFDDLDRLEADVLGGSSDDESSQVGTDMDADLDEDDIDEEEETDDDDTYEDDVEDDPDVLEEEDDGDQQGESDEVDEWGGLSGRGPEGAGAVESPPDTNLKVSAPAPTKYIPPALRRAAAAETESPVPPPTETNPLSSTLAKPTSDPRIRRHLLGLLNRLSATNISTLLSQIETVYSSNPRAIISTTLVELILEMVSSRDRLGESFIVIYAALVGALSMAVGAEFRGMLVTRCAELYDESRRKFKEAENSAVERLQGSGEEVDARPGSKESTNLVAFVAELYNFQIISCTLIYDFVRGFIDGGLDELEVELLLKILKISGPQLRQDDPTALKEIVSLVNAKVAGVDPSSMSSRKRFLIETFTNLKNNKIKSASGAGTSTDAASTLKKFLTSLSKARTVHLEALRASLSDLRSSSQKGKWWLVGAAWSGDPLAEGALAKKAGASTEGEEVLLKLAKQQGMTTDIRKSIFVALMSSEDYVDACDRILQLGLTEVQRREIVRVILQCCGNEKTYNPYYTLVMQRLVSHSSQMAHSFQVTLQFALWDFLRQGGEQDIGGAELVKSSSKDGSGAGVVKPNMRRYRNVAKAYGWWIGMNTISLTVLKPVPFATLLPQTQIFFQTLFSAVLISTQSSSPTLKVTSTNNPNTQAIEEVFEKATDHPTLSRGIAFFLGRFSKEIMGAEDGSFMEWALETATSALQT